MVICEIISRFYFDGKERSFYEMGAIFNYINFYRGLNTKAVYDWSGLYLGITSFEYAVCCFMYFKIIYWSTSYDGESEIRIVSLWRKRYDFSRMNITKDIRYVIPVPPLF